MNAVTTYFRGDSMASDVWKDKYQMKNKLGEAMENTPFDTHMRMAREFGRIEYKYVSKEINNFTKETVGNISYLSDFGKELYYKRVGQSEEDISDELFEYFNKFKHIIPQGSIMANLGNPYVFGSLSNCFVVAPPKDSIGGIMKTDEEMAQLFKRRGGVGTHLNNLRPTLAYVSNASKTSTGIPSFAERYSNTTREIAQEGRRGALMLLLSVKHPDIFRFVRMKDDRSKLTGTNVSVMFTDEFMEKVESNEDFLCTFPVDAEIGDSFETALAYNVLMALPNKRGSDVTRYIMKIHAKELFDEFVNMAWSNGEPGAAFIDRIINYSPDGVYDQYRPEACNPCGEQWFTADDSCRLITQNLYSLVINPFKEDAHIDFDKLYEVSYIQQRLGDNLVDLEVEHIDRIIEKVISDPEGSDIKTTEIELWQRIRKTALSGRRTGNGFTGLGDMLAALGLPYGGEDSLGVVEQVLKTKMKAELDATIDMGITRGTFEGWNRYKEFEYEGVATKDTILDVKYLQGLNSFYVEMKHEFPEQALRNFKYGRRNVNWSTEAPNGTMGIMTQTTSGLEPVFKCFYIRRRKVNANQKNMRVDFVDPSGDSWQEYGVLHPKFKEWLKVYLLNSIEFSSTLLSGYKLERRDVDDDLQNELIDMMSKEKLQAFFEISPWYKSEANDVHWSDRVKTNSIIQKYTSNSLSCTINLPEDIDKETVYNIYYEGWKAGLKGITIYREGSRTGVLISDKKITKPDEFGYNDAIKRPETLEADYHYIRANGKDFAIIVGKMNNNPYELFAFQNPMYQDALKGTVTKVKSGHYRFESNGWFENNGYTIDNVQISELADEKLLTRWTSQLLRHGVNPKFVAEQVEKSEIQITSFAKAIARVLKSYVPDQQTKEKCPNCSQETIIYEEGCKKCTNCGHSKC